MNSLANTFCILATFQQNAIEFSLLQEKLKNMNKYFQSNINKSTLRYSLIIEIILFDIKNPKYF